MAKCPKCSKEITHLRDWSRSWQEFRFSLDIQGDGQYEPACNTVPDDVGPDDYECPECNKVLFTDHDEAEQFLKGVTKEEIATNLS